MDVQPIYLEHASGTLRELAETDVIGTRDAPVTPTSTSVSSVVSDQILVAPTAGMSLRLRRFHLHMDPAAVALTFNTVTLKLGATVVFSDKFEPGLPYAEGVVVLGGVDEALTITTSDAATIFVNVRTEEIAV